MKQYKPRDKVTQKITREGAVEENQTTGKSENISGKEKEADFSGRLHFTEEDRAMPELDRYIRKAEQAADKAEAARERIPKKKKLTRERLYDEAKSKGKTKLRFKEVEKPMSEVEKTNPVSRPASLAGRMITGKAHGKIHEVEKENSGVEAGHSIERTGERALSKSSGMAKTALRNHRLKPYREAAKAERALHKANVNFQYHKALSENPSLSSNPLSRFLQKQKIKHNYTKDVKNAGKAAGKTGQAADAAMEQDLQYELDNYESLNPGYDEYRFDLDGIHHDPHELAAYLSAYFGGAYTPASAQGQLQTVFELQYELTETETEEIRYRTETRMDTWTDEDGNTHTDTYEVEVPYTYYIMTVTLKNHGLFHVAEETLTAEQLELYQAYRDTSGNMPLLFGGGSFDTSPSTDLSGVEFVNGTRPGNQEIIDLAKAQVGNVGGQPYWSWYGFDSRVEWCACFVSWCINQAGYSEPRFAACASQGVPWFKEHGQWAAGNYTDVAPGDVIFFDWDGGGSDHVGLVIGTDGTNVYTVEGNSGDACKIKSYPLNSQYIHGYGLMNW